MATSLIDGDFQTAVANLDKARSALYDAGFENIGPLHAALVAAMSDVMNFIPNIVTAVDIWYEDEEGAAEYPGFEETGIAYEAAAAASYIEFLNLRNSLDRVMSYAHYYNEFSNSLSDLTTFCEGYDSDRGTIVL
jgi:hypothetical protein